MSDNQLPAQHPDAPAPQPGTVAEAARQLGDDTLADGQWHRLHPATPLLRGGLFLVAVLGYLIANMRERLISLFTGGDEFRDYEGDPIDWILAEHLVGWALAVVALVLVVLIAGFYLSWRMHSFRVTQEAVEVRSGILFRRHRRAALDRIQGINVNRPLIPRLFGAAKLQVSVAGQGASVELAYLGSAKTDGLRRDILRLSSGAKGQPQPTAGPAGAPPSPGAAGAASDYVTARVNELIVPDWEQDAATPASVVRIPPLRLLGSVVLSGTTIVLLAFIIAIIVSSIVGTPWVLFGILPAMIGFATYYWSRFTKFLRYSIAATPHGVRIGYGLLSTSNETLPPGRIHAIEVRQPLIWRPLGWWEIRINTAVQGSSANAQQKQQSGTVMPVGDLDDVARVLALLLPGLPPESGDDLVRRGLLGTGSDDDYTTAPRRSWIFNPLTWRRVGFALLGDVLVTRDGFAHRRLAIVPLARIQSVKITQGPWQRRRTLATGHAHTVLGPVSARVSQLGRDDALRFFDRVTTAAISAAAADTSEHWAADPE
ncbi:putative membrane protein [Paramicrobacterium humi]|uniref:Putative membrane protein n=1 Tax=Paramicrobacterium humi TaxID=640635 RepID=A0A1H4MR36_9MICO|nr:PH domain-containing protein [Microbacterium humi]SEB85128.1 putative membrane protein [Microbacterium humi]